MRSGRRQALHEGLLENARGCDDGAAGNACPGTSEEGWGGLGAKCIGHSVIWVERSVRSCGMQQWRVRRNRKPLVAAGRELALQCVCVCVVYRTVTHTTSILTVCVRVSVCAPADPLCAVIEGTAMCAGNTSGCVLTCTHTHTHTHTHTPGVTQVYPSVDALLCG